MQTLFSPYVLKFKNGSAEQKGALLKCIQGSDWGVADLCPKPLLGDLDLKNEILQKGPLFERALQLAMQDLEARRSKKSLLLDKPIKNNFLINNLENLNWSTYRLTENTFKLKASQNIELLLEKINSLLTLQPINVKLRIDFNSKLSEQQFENFLNQLNSQMLELIEYIEDPTLMSEKWLKWNKKVPLAYDLQKSEFRQDWAQFQIIKPARQNINKLSKNFTLTSSMDHAVGVSHGLRIAQQMAQNDSGFLTLDLYHDDGFNKYYRQQENWLNFSELALNDYGIGMTSELNQLQWCEFDRMSF